MKITKKQKSAQAQETITTSPPQVNTNFDVAVPVERQFLKDFAPLVRKYDIYFSYDSYNSRWRIVFNANSKFPSLMKMNDLIREIDEIKKKK